MGTDTKGKQEVDPALLAKAATVFTDEVAQSVAIGEWQHAMRIAAERSSRRAPMTPIGAVINGVDPRTQKRSEDEVTLFDGTGVGLQDLAVASVAAKLAQAQGKATKVAL